MQYDIEEERNKEKGNGVEQGEQVQVMEDNKEKRVLVLCPQRKPGVSTSSSYLLHYTVLPLPFSFWQGFEAGYRINL